MHDDLNDDDLEDVPHVPGMPPPRPMTATIEGHDADRVERMLVAFLAQQMTKAGLDAIRKEARALAQARIAAGCADLIDAEVRTIVTNGWAEVKPWGEPTGEKFTIRSFLMKYISTETYDQPGNGYGPRRTPVDRAIEAAIKAVFSKEFEQEIEEARRRLRKALDDDLAARLASTIKSALGLR